MKFFTKTYQKALQMTDLYWSLKVFPESEFLLKELEHVPGIRVPALGMISRENRKRIRKISRESRLYVDQIDRRYQAHYTTVKDRIPKHIECIGWLHDHVIEAAYFSGSDFVLETDILKGAYGGQRVIFRNCKILQQERDLIGLYWLYEEIYPTKEGYEIQVLLSGREMAYLTMTATDVQTPFAVHCLPEETEDGLSS